MFCKKSFASMRELCFRRPSMRAPPRATLLLCSPLAEEDDTFEDFYDAQRIVPPSEFSDFLSTLRTPLPLDVRSSPSCACEPRFAYARLLSA